MLAYEQSTLNNKPFVNWIDPHHHFMHYKYKLTSLFLILIRQKQSHELIIFLKNSLKVNICKLSLFHLMI